MEDNTWTRIDMEYLFECSTQYLLSDKVNELDTGIYNWTREDIFHIYKEPHNILLIIYCINILIMLFLTIFWRFLTTFQSFPKIQSTNCLKATQMSSNISQDDNGLPKIPEETKGISEDVFIVHQPTFLGTVLV